MGPFVLAETSFPSFLPRTRTPTSKKNKSISSTPASIGSSTNNSLSSLEQFGESEEHHVEVIHLSPGRRQRTLPENDARTTTITSTRSREGDSGYHLSPNHQFCTPNSDSSMSLQLDRYGFITNIDSKGHILETNGAEAISVPRFKDSERTERREKKWGVTLQNWDKQNRQGKLSDSFKNGGNSKPNKSLMRQALPKGKKLIMRRLRKGVPDSVRGKTWNALGGGIQTPGLYQEIVKTTSTAMLEHCRELKKINQEGKQFIETPDGNDHSDRDQSPERGTAESNSTSNRTSPTSAVSESTSTDSPLNKATKSDTSTPSTPNSADEEPSPQSTREEEKEPSNYAATREFRSIQDIIERDIHRTYPRHSLFYEEEKPSADPVESDHESSGSNSRPSSPVNSPTSGIGDPEIAALILNLEMDLRIANALSTDKNAAVGLQQYSIHDGNGNCTIQASTQGGQAALRRVLRAYSYHDREVGYCQGMNFIAGMFLTIMPEEEAFWLLVSVMSEKPCHMRGLFGVGMLQTHKVLFVAEKLINHYLYRLARHFEKENVHVTMYATQWLLTQYTSSFKFDMVFRIWDAFLGEGWKIIYRVMLALLQKYQSQLLKMSFEEILTFFRELPDRVDGNHIMDMALKVPLRRKVIAKYEKEWDAKQQQQ